MFMCILTSLGVALKDTASAHILNETGESSELDL